MSMRQARADELRRLHLTARPLVLVNVWDAVSARVVAAAGAEAIATASWSIAAAHGLPDGEALSLDAMLEAVAVVAHAVDLPVTADLERGYGDARAAVAGAVAAGAVGCNLEDADGLGGLVPAAEHAATVAAARAAAEDAGVPIVINARTDVYLEDAIAPEARLAAALERGAAYLAAGADCIFVPGVRDLPTLTALARDMGGPISVLGGADGPSLAALSELGIARVSYGPGPLGVALAALSRAARALLGGDAPPADLAFRP